MARGTKRWRAKVLALGLAPLPRAAMRRSPCRQRSLCRCPAWSASGQAGLLPGYWFRAPAAAASAPAPVPVMPYGCGGPGIDPARLGLIGWSNGGSNVLAATNTRHPEVVALQVRASLAVAFYPGCEAES
jgi:hypothetical protein